MAASCAGTAAAPAVAVRSERLISDWPAVSLALSGKNVVLAKSTAPRIVPGGFTVFRTDTVRFPLNGDRLTRRTIEDIIFRTSAGRTTAGPIAGDTTGRYIIVATGSNFPPQPIFCCTSEPRDLPLEPDGRPDAPTTVAAALDGPVARYVLRNPDGTHAFVNYWISDAPGQPFHQRISRPLAGERPALVAMGPGIVATVDAATGRSIHLATTSTGSYDPSGDEVLPPQPGTVSRLHVTRTMVVALVRTASGYELVRHDAPTWTRTVIWRGTRAPGLTAASDRTVAFINGTTVMQSVPGRTRQLLRLRGKLTALATDGRRVTVAERRTVLVRRKKTRKTAIIVASVLQPPGVYSAGGGS